MKRNTLIILLTFTAIFLQAQITEITDISVVEKRDGSKVVDVDYELSGPDPQYAISAQVSFDNGNIYHQIRTATGDYGQDVVNDGSPKHFEWEFGADYPDEYTSSAKVKINAFKTYQFVCGHPLRDSRDGKSYKTIKIGNQCWMAENINIGQWIGWGSQTNNGIIEKYCYNFDTSNCDIYGGLYEWNEMMGYTSLPPFSGICPPDGGWHIPTDIEWTQLVDYLGGLSVAGGKLKEAGTAHWNPPNTGATNSSNFTGLPGGYRCYYDWYFDWLGEKGIWWSSNLDGSSQGMYYALKYDDEMVEAGGTNTLNAFSVRCIHDYENQPPGQPSDPNPQHGASLVGLNPTLSWTCNDPEGDMLFYRVYFGVQANPPLVATTSDVAEYSPGNLSGNTTYFWRVTAIDIMGDSTAGTVWVFGTENDLPPTQPSNPSPQDGASAISLNPTLSWSCTEPNGQEMTYSVYFGTSSNPPLLVTNWNSQSYSPATLNSGTLYYWKIIAFDINQNYTEGPVWSFITQVSQCGTGFPVIYEGQSYNTVAIGSQCWMAENLNVGEMINSQWGGIMGNGQQYPGLGVIEKHCYNDDIANCNEYGGLYQFDMAKYGSSGIEICMPGWHIPTQSEFNILINFLGGYSVAGGELKETGSSHWNSPNTGATNSNGFTALPGGTSYYSQPFSGLGTNGHFWTISLYNGYPRYLEVVYNGTSTYWNYDYYHYGKSVRCLRDSD